MHTRLVLMIKRLKHDLQQQEGHYDAQGRGVGWSSCNQVALNETSAPQVKSRTADTCPVFESRWARHAGNKESSAICVTSCPPTKVNVCNEAWAPNSVKLLVGLDRTATISYQPGSHHAQQQKQGKVTCDRSLVEYVKVCHQQRELIMRSDCHTSRQTLARAQTGTSGLYWDNET